MVVVAGLWMLVHLILSNTRWCDLRRLGQGIAHYAMIALVMSSFIGRILDRISFSSVDEEDIS